MPTKKRPLFKGQDLFHSAGEKLDGLAERTRPRLAAAKDRLKSRSEKHRNSAKGILIATYIGAAEFELQQIEKMAARIKALEREWEYIVNEEYKNAKNNSDHD